MLFGACRAFSRKENNIYALHPMSTFVPCPKTGENPNFRHCRLFSPTCYSTVLYRENFGHFRRRIFSQNEPNFFYPIAVQYAFILPFGFPLRAEFQAIAFQAFKIDVETARVPDGARKHPQIPKSRAARPVVWGWHPRGTSSAIGQIRYLPRTIQ
jgi:hypothetical protein